MERLGYTSYSGYSSFESIRQHGDLFVDKTAVMFDLLKRTRSGFMIRPPHFGKTLLHSMLTAYFQGKRELFKGLAIEKLETDWERREVFYIDFTRGKFDKSGSLNAYLSGHLTMWEHQYDCFLPDRTYSIQSRLHDLVDHAKELTGSEPVLLIDGYDQPMLDALYNSDVLEAHRNTMKHFLTSFEGRAHGVDFLLVTGITMFGLWDPLFGGFQGYFDFSTYDRYATLVGITEEELRGQLSAEVRGLAEAEKIGEEECYERLRREYGGYWFGTHERQEVYEPYHLLLALKNKTFSPRAEGDGKAPDYFRSIVRKRKYIFEKNRLTDGIQYTLFKEDALDTTNEMLLFHHGYFQRGEEVGKDNFHNKLYELKFPNSEVERRFYSYMIELCMPYYMYDDITRKSLSLKSLKPGEEKYIIKKINKHFADKKKKPSFDSFMWGGRWDREEDTQTEEEKEAKRQKARKKLIINFYNSMACWLWLEGIPGLVARHYSFLDIVTFTIGLPNCTYAFTFYEEEKDYEAATVYYPSGVEKADREVSVLFARGGKLIAKWKVAGEEEVVVEDGKDEESKGFWFGL